MPVLFGDLTFSAAQVEEERRRLESEGIKTVYQRTLEEVKGYSFDGPDGLAYPSIVYPGIPTDPTKPLLAIVDNNYECVHTAMKYAQNKVGSTYSVCGFVVGMDVRTDTLAECIVKVGVNTVLVDKPQYVHDDCPACNESIDLYHMLHTQDIHVILGDTYVQADACSIAFRAAIDRLSANGVHQN